MNNKNNARCVKLTRSKNRTEKTTAHEADVSSEPISWFDCACTCFLWFLFLSFPFSFIPDIYVSFCLSFSSFLQAMCLVCVCPVFRVQYTRDAMYFHCIVACDHRAVITRHRVDQHGHWGRWMPMGGKRVPMGRNLNAKLRSRRQRLAAAASPLLLLRTGAMPLWACLPHTHLPRNRLYVRHS